MSLEQRKSIYGIHQITAYDINNRIPLGTAKVIGSVALNFAGELIELQGGSNLFPWAIESGPISTEMNVTLKEYPNWLFPAFLGQNVTENTAEASGSVSSALENVKGTSLQSATTGIDSITVKTGNEADLKSGNYVVEAASATTVNVYALSDVDFAQGTDKTYADESLKINDAPLTVVSGDATDIAGFGLEINGGSGTIALTVGDTAVFEVRAANSGSDEVVVGSNASVYKDIGLLITAQRKGDAEMVMFDVFRAKAIGIPFNLTEKEFSESELALRAYRDEDRNGVFKMSRVRALA